MRRQRRWDADELRRAEEEVGLRPVPAVRPRIQSMTGDVVPWYGRLGIAMMVCCVVGWFFIGAAEGHGTHHRFPHGREPWQLIGIVLAVPGSVMFVVAVIVGIGCCIRWVVRG